MEFDLIPWGRATFILDFVGIVMLIIIPLQCYSIYLAKVKRKLATHRRIQIISTISLFTAVIAFEVNMRIYGWRHLAEPSIYWETLVFPSLYVHLFFSITTIFLWLTCIIQALRKFGKNPQPNEYSNRHKIWGWLAFGDLVLTTISGAVFYILAYIC